VEKVITKASGDERHVFDCEVPLLIGVDEENGPHPTTLWVRNIWGKKCWCPNVLLVSDINERVVACMMPLYQPQTADIE